MRWQTGALALLGGLMAPWLAIAPATAADSLGVGVDGAGSDGVAAQERDGARGDRDQDRATAREKGEKGKKKGLQPGQTKRAEVVKAGWWWVVNEPPPETGVIAAPQPPTPTTPKGTYPVGAFGGDPEKVSAIEVRLAAKAGSGVRDFTMVLRESAEPGANANAENAKILACPVTELFWADGNAAAWKDRPAYECATGVPGKRDAKGVWSFDLTDLAAGWLAEGNTDSRSVVLVEDVEAPEAFQVTFDGPRLEGVGLSLKATPPPPSEGPVGGGSGGSGGTTGGGSVSGGSGSVGGSVGGGAPATSPGSTVPAAGGDAPDAAAPEAAGTPGQVALQPVAAPSWYSGLPKGMFVLLPLVLMLAYLVMLSLGPDARPAPVTGRHGVSKALDRLRQAGRRAGVGR